MVQIAKMQRMTRRGWVVLGGFGLVALLIGAGVLHHFRLKRAVEQYRRELAAKGNKLTVAELAPKKDQAALDAGAELLGAASRTYGISPLSPGIMRLVAPGRAQVASQQERLLDEKGTNLWPKLTTILAEQQACWPLHAILSNTVAFICM